MKKIIRTMVALALVTSAGFNFAKAEQGRFYFEPTVSFPKLVYDYPVVLYDNNNNGLKSDANPVFIEHNAKLLPEFKGGYILPSGKGSFDISWMRFDSEERKDLFPGIEDLIYTTTLFEPNFAWNADPFDTFISWHKFHLTAVDLQYTKFAVSNSKYFLGVSGGIRYIEVENDLQMGLYGSAGDYYITSLYKSEMMGPKIGLTAKRKFSKHFGLNAKTAFAFLAGRADYTLTTRDLNNSPSTQVVIDLAAKDRLRLVPVTEVECGVFVSPWKSLVLNFGYKASAWFNLVKQIEFVDDYAEYRSNKDYTITMSGFFFGATLYFG